jgi:hypothetical protein
LGLLSGGYLAVQAGGLMTRFGAALPEFKTITWATGYLTDAK